MSDTPLLALPYLEAAQAQKHITVNEALSMIDGLIHLAVLSRTLAQPPATPLDGDRYLIAASASGEWSGHAGELALRMEGAWRFFIPREGWRLWVSDENALLAFDGSAWVASSVPSTLQNLQLVGINATADTANRLSVTAPAVLFNHAGAGHQVKVNKNATADTASFLFQTNFSGRAEIGTSGDDNFHFKVSSNGASFTDAMVIDATSGLVTLRKSAVLEPQAGDPASPVNGQIWYNATSAKFRLRQNGTTQDMLGGGGGGAAWGGITGTLSAQADLQAALDGKQVAGAYAAAVHNHAASQITDFNAAADTRADTRIAAASVNALADVVITAPANGQVLKYNGTAWVNGTDDAGGGGGTQYMREAVAIAVPGSATPSVVGLALTATGTSTGATPASTNVLTQQARLEYLVTTAAATAVAGWRFSTNTLWRGSAAGQGGFRFRCRWGNATGAATATNRCFVGLSTNTAAPTDVEPSSLLNMIGMGWDAADANIQLMHNDGAGIATKEDHGVSFPVPIADRAAAYEIELTASPNAASIEYKITNLGNAAVAQGSVTTDLIANTAFVSPRGYMSVGGTSSVIGISLMKLSLESDY